MNKIKNGGAAFACAAENGHQEGMSLRDYFAGQALAGLLSRQVVQGDVTAYVAAVWSYEYADAMLKAREVSDGK